jgi:Cu/Ag efflux pump CusA
MRRIAAPMIGGMITAPLLSMLDGFTVTETLVKG